MYSARKLPMIHGRSTLGKTGRALGTLSIALGVMDLLAARRIARFIGMPRSEGLIRACGVREVVSGAGMIAARNPAPWAWSRVAGDALDMAGLAPGLTRSNERRKYAWLMLAGVAALAAADLIYARKLAQRPSPARPVRHDYRSRSGFPRPPELMRGAARSGHGRQVGADAIAQAGL